MPIRTIDTAYFPGFTRKSLTFTIDDGNLEMDKRFLDIVAPHGIRGTFNLCTPKLDQLSPEGYRELYRGNEIANHCKNHPTAARDGFEYKRSYERLTDRATADPDLLYDSATENIYFVHYYRYTGNEEYKKNPSGWHPMAFAEHFCELVSACHTELEEVFGKGSIKDFAWPHGKQYNKQIVEYIKSIGYRSIRRTGDMRDKTNFEFPTDRFDWTYNAHNKTLLEVMKLYEAYPDDGRLKFFAMGVHSFDFERSGNWEDLVEFARLYGDRPEDYYYATVGELFDYEDAVRSLRIGAESVENVSDVTLYAVVNGERVVLEPHTKYDF